MSKEQIIAEVLSLSASERELLAEELLLSLDHTNPSDIEASWKAESEKRVRSILSGEATLYDGKETLNFIRHSRPQ